MLGDPDSRNLSPQCRQSWVWVEKICLIESKTRLSILNIGCSQSVENESRGDELKRLPSHFGLKNNGLHKGTIRDVRVSIEDLITLPSLFNCVSSSEYQGRECAWH